MSKNLEGEEVNLNLLAALFLVGLLILFGIYFVFYDNSHSIDRSITYTKNVMRSTGVSLRSSLEGFVNGLKDFFSTKRKTLFLTLTSKFTLGNFEFESCADCVITSNFEEGNNVMGVNYEIPHNKNWLSIFIHKIIERLFNVPVDYGWVSIASEVSNADWGNHENINLFVKNSGEPSRFEFAIQEADGDTWYYFDEKSLNNKDETLVNMPFKDFVHPPWASLGDGKKEFKNVTMFQLTITSFDRAVNNTLEFSLKDNSLISLA